MQPVSIRIEARQNTFYHLHNATHKKNAVMQILTELAEKRGVDFKTVASLRTHHHLKRRKLKFVPQTYITMGYCCQPITHKIK